MCLLCIKLLEFSETVPCLSIVCLVAKDVVVTCFDPFVCSGYVGPTDLEKITFFELWNKLIDRG